MPNAPKIDILRVAFILNPWSEQTEDMHLRHAAIAGKLANDTKRDCGPVRSSAGEYAPGKIATEMLFSHRNDALLVLTGIAKA